MKRREIIKDIAEILPQYVTNVNLQLNSNYEIDIKKTILCWLKKYIADNGNYLNDGIMPIDTLFILALTWGDAATCDTTWGAAKSTKNDESWRKIFQTEFAKLAKSGNLEACQWLWNSSCAETKKCLLTETWGRAISFTVMGFMRNALEQGNTGLFTWLLSCSRQVFEQDYSTLIDMLFKYLA